MNRPIVFVLLALTLSCMTFVENVAHAADNATEFGVEDDLWVGGTGGVASDPDVEIKGFTVFGATQTSYSPGIPIGAGNVIVNGYLGVSSGAYFVGGSTFSTQGAYFLGISSFSDVANIYVGGTGAANNKALLYDGSDGSLKWGDISALVSGDNLGNHVATTTLNMNSWDITNVSTITFKANVFISSAPSAQYGGLYISTNTYLAGSSYINTDLTVNGNTTVNTDLAVKGNTTLGDGGDVITVNGSDTSGTKFMLFRSGGSDVAWMRKK